MHIVNAILIILGLAVFEIISSIDNAVINAEILSTMSEKAKKWFLLWGFIFAVVVMRGVLPWLIVWIANPSIGLIGALTATFSSDPLVAESVARSAPILLGIGGVFLGALFLRWFLRKDSSDPEQEHEIAKDISDFRKILHLELIDALFSIDGVVGAFAFTLSVPYILIGNGIGAYVLRELTVKNIERIKKYTFLKKGAMYAIGSLSVIMLFGAFGHEAPEWVSPVVMFLIVGFFFLRSKKNVAA